MNSSPPVQHPLRGILLFMLALMLFALLDATAKHLTATFAVPLLVWARYTLHFLIMLIFVAPSMRARLVKTDNLSLQVVRALALVGTSGFTMVAFRTMPLAEATAVLFLAPLLVTLMAGPFLGERIGSGRWLAVVVGFAGVLLIASLGFYGGIGHFLLIRAFRLAQASVLMPFTYTQLIWAALLGWLMFGHVPDILSAAGMIVIAAAGLWLALGERQRS